MICGEPPHLRLWHFQWLAAKDLYSDLRQFLPTVGGRVLDVGCGNKPYGVWLDEEKVEHIGIDLYPSSKVDVVVKAGGSWPLETASFDTILCTQVLEHVVDLNETLNEITRVLKPKGILIATVPFIYNLHGAPEDYRRFSIHGVSQLFEEGYEMIEVRPQGGIGSTLGTLWLNWVEVSMNRWKPTRLLKGMLMPLWILFCASTNVIGYLLDELDQTQSFYSNTLVIAKKRTSDIDLLCNTSGERVWTLRSTLLDRRRNTRVPSPR